MADTPNVKENFELAEVAKTDNDISFKNRKST